MKIIQDYIKTKSTSVTRYFFEQVIFLFCQMIPTIVGILLRNVFYRCIIKANGIFCIEENVQICHAKNLKLRKNVFIGRNAYIGASGGGITIYENAIIMDNCYINVFNYFASGTSSITIHENVVLSTGCVLHGHSGVEIGRNTIVGPQTVFVSGEHGDIAPDSNYRFAECTVNTPIYIGENVWIGSNVIILPGVTIGSHAVIGAGSIVTKDVPGFTVYAGNPARMLREIK